MSLAALSNMTVKAAATTAPDITMTDADARPLGLSRLEQLPIELIHDIHFWSPNNSLLATSKTMFSYFTPDALPAARTANWLSHLWNNRVEHGSKSTRPTFILKRRYTHSPRMLRCILRALDLPPGYRVVHYAPLDPSDYIISGGWLPPSLLHHIYHTYATDPSSLSEAVRHLLLRKRYEEADVLLSLGADPRTSHMDVLQPAEVFFLPPHAVSHLTEIAWSPKWLRRRSCPCGWEGTPSLPTPSQRAILRITAQALKFSPSIEATSRSIYKFIGTDLPELEEITNLAEDEGGDYPKDNYSPWVQCFMLPFSGTVAKFPVQLCDKYADVARILKLPVAPEHGRLAFPIRREYERILWVLGTAVCKDYWTAYKEVLERDVV